MQILSIAASVAALVCWIMTLIKMFQNDKILLAILGILCPLWAFIWGWMNVAQVGQKLMLIWTIAAVISAATGSSYTSSFR